MNSLLSSLTAALLLVHVALGCCWHHVHECVAGDAQGPTPALARACCHPHDDQPGSSDSQGPCKYRVECQGTCQLLPGRKVQLDRPLAVVLATPAVTQILAEAPAERRFCAWQLPPRPTDGPTRLYLLHQLLLI